MRYLSSSMLCVGALALMGCETASDGPLSFSAYQEQGVPSELVTLIEDEDYSDLLTLPTTGALELEGAIALGIADQPNFLIDPDSLHSYADLFIRIDLSTNDVTGRADNFVQQDNSRPRGFLDVNGSIDRDADLLISPGFRGSINGAFEGEDGTVTVITSRAEGDLYGEDGAYLFGVANGNAAVDGVNTGFYATYVLE